MNPKDNGIAFMVVLFGLLAAVSLGTLAPDQSRGKMAGIKIFSIMETPSKINAVDEKPAK